MTKKIDPPGLDQFVYNLVDARVADLVPRHGQVINGAVEYFWGIAAHLIIRIDVAIHESHTRHQGFCQAQLEVRKTSGVKAFTEAINAGLADLGQGCQGRDTGACCSVRIRQDGTGHLTLRLVETRQRIGDHIDKVLLMHHVLSLVMTLGRLFRVRQRLPVSVCDYVVIIHNLSQKVASSRRSLGKM